MGGASFGLQIGGQSSEVMLLIMTSKGINSVINNKVKLGADISAAVGPVGVGAEASTTTNLRADIYSFHGRSGDGENPARSAVAVISAEGRDPQAACLDARLDR